MPAKHTYELIYNKCVKRRKISKIDKRKITSKALDEYIFFAFLVIIWKLLYKRKWWKYLERESEGKENKIIHHIISTASNSVVCDVD